MSQRTTLLEDTFTFKTIPFLVEVEELDMFIDGESGETNGVNFHNAPTGHKTVPSKSWRICRCIIARVRPDYPYTIKQEWPENIDKHFHIVEPLEIPTKSEGWIFTTWDVEQYQYKEDIDVNKLAESVVDKMKTAYKNRTKVNSLES